MDAKLFSFKEETVSLMEAYFSPVEIMDKPVYILGKVLELQGKFKSVSSSDTQMRKLKILKSDVI